jgi:hypothetical protein
MKNMWMLVLMSVMLGQGVVASTLETPGALSERAPVGTPSPGSTPGKVAGRIGGFFGRSPKQDSLTDLSKKRTQDIFSDSGLAPSTLKKSALTEQNPQRKALYAGMALYRDQNPRTKQLTSQDEGTLKAIPGAVAVLKIAQTTANTRIGKNTERVRQFEALPLNTFLDSPAPSGGKPPEAGDSDGSTDKVAPTSTAFMAGAGAGGGAPSADGQSAGAPTAGLQTHPLVTGTGQGANPEGRPEGQPVAGQGVGAGAGSAGSPPRSRAASASGQGPNLEGRPEGQPVAGQGVGAAAGSVGSPASGSTAPAGAGATSDSGQGVGPLGLGSPVADPVVTPAAPLVGGDPATDLQGQPIVPAPVEPKNYKAAFGFAVPAAIVGAIWVWLAATKQGRELLGSMRKLFTKKGRASLTAQQKREAIEDLVTLAVTSGLGVASGGYALHSARKTYTHNRNLPRARNHPARQN